VKFVSARNAICDILDARPRGRGPKHFLICPTGKWAAV
jgi:hypothetical protein